MHLLKFIMIPILSGIPLVVNASMINGALTTDSFLATDSFGSFYYNYLDVTNTGAADATLSVSLTADINLMPWIMYWASASTLPENDWANPVDLFESAAETAFSFDPGSKVSFTDFTLAAGETYQMLIATSDYIEDNAQLDSYFWDITSSTGDQFLSVKQFSSVPEPEFLVMLGLGLAGLASQRKKISL